MLEIELKSVVDDLSRRRRLAEEAGATLVFAGRLEDRRYDTTVGALVARDNMLRLRTYRAGDNIRAELDWKGPTVRAEGYKLREELGTRVLDPTALSDILGRLGYVVTAAIDRQVLQFDLSGAMVRFESYPRMDDLVEVEGSRDQIERAIAVLEMPRSGFTDERLQVFMRRFEARTGMRAILSEADTAHRVADPSDG